MYKLALTGNIASGKSFVEKIFSEYGLCVIDTDKITHDLLCSSDVKNILRQNFGLEIFENDTVSRKKLGKIVFENNDKRKILENILHPLIKEEIFKFFEIHKSEKAVVVSVPLLFEAGMQDIFDKILFVSADVSVRLERLMKRNNLTKEEAILRINAQNNEDLKISKSDFVFYNNSSFEDLKFQVDNFIKQYL